MLISNQDDLLIWLSYEPDREFTQADHKLNQFLYLYDFEHTEYLYFAEIKILVRL